MFKATTYQIHVNQDNLLFVWFCVWQKIDKFCRCWMNKTNFALTPFFGWRHVVCIRILLGLVGEIQSDSTFEKKNVLIRRKFDLSPESLAWRLKPWGWNFGRWGRFRASRLGFKFRGGVVGEREGVFPFVKAMTVKAKFKGSFGTAAQKSDYNELWLVITEFRRWTTIIIHKLQKRQEIANDCNTLQMTKKIGMKLEMITRLQMARQYTL